MKKLIFIFLIFSGICQGQAVQTLIPGRTVLVSNLDIAAIGGTDTLFKFIMPAGSRAYSIEILQTDTIETVATGGFLYGSNDGGNLVAIGDSVSIAKDVATQVDWFTGTVWSYYMGMVKINKLTVSAGKVTIILYYN